MNSLLDKIKGYDLEFLFDRSGTMTKTDCYNGMSRWNYMQESAVAFLHQTAALDPDGVDVRFFANRIKSHFGVTAAKLEDLFLETFPMGGTNTAEAIRQSLEGTGRDDGFFVRLANGDYDPGAEKKGMIITVFTDGKPDDEDGVIKLIADASKRIKDRKYLGFNFIQVGHDEEAAKHLRVLDDKIGEIQGYKDIVNALPIDDLETFAPAEVLWKALTE